jgi:hypothetical protein
MFKSILLIFIIFSRQSIAQNLLYHWPFNNNLDEVINAKHASNATSFSYSNDKFGRPNSSICFIRSFGLGYAKLPPASYLSKEFTISVWIRISVYHHFLCCKESFLFVFRNDKNKFVVSFISNHLTITVYLHDLAVFKLQVSKQLREEKWEHLTFTKNSTMTTIYINGEKDVSLNLPTYHFDFVNYYTSENYIAHKSILCMDDLKIFHRDLTAQEVLTNMNKQFNDSTSQINMKAKPRFNVTELDIYVNEFEDFSFEIKLNQGTQPLFYYLNEKASNQIQLIKNKIYWPKVTSDKQINCISIKATNSLGSDELKLKINIIPIYSIQLTQLTTTDYLQHQQVFMSGTSRLNSNNKLILKQSLKFNLIIQYLNYTLKRQLQTNSEGTFFYKYEINSKEYGIHRADAKHPFDRSEPVTQIQWNVLGFELDQTKFSISGFTGQLSKQNIKLTNVNLITLNNLRLSFYGSSNRFHLTVNNCEISECILADQLVKETSIDLQISILTNTSLYERIAIRIRTDEQVSAIIYLDLSFVDKIVKLIASPPQLSFRIKENEKLFFDFELTNKGYMNATDLSIQFSKPACLNFELASMINKNNKNKQETNKFYILTNETIQFTFSVFFNNLNSSSISNQEFYIFVSDHIQIPVSFVISSFTDTSLTVSVEDEFTYFSNDKPNLANAIVTLSNGKMFKQKAITNASGYATFVNLNENIYEVLVEADRHSFKRLIWQPIKEQNYLSVFLERRTVSILFTVVPRLIENKFKITLESEFEANVPAPVVTADPMYVDLDELRTGLIDIFTFNLTNHGLIKANGLEITLPIIKVITLNKINFRRAASLNKELRGNFCKSKTSYTYQSIGNPIIYR